MFYLTEELYVLSLCDEKTTFAEKAEIERALFDTDLRQTLLPKKSFLESHLFKTPLRLKISRLYWRTVLGNIWSLGSPENWSNTKTYKRFYKLVIGIVCFNEVAEPNVKNF